MTKKKRLRKTVGYMNRFPVVQKDQLVGGFNPLEKHGCQIGSFPQIGVKIKNLWNHHPENIKQFHHDVPVFLKRRTSIIAALPITKNTDGACSHQMQLLETPPSCFVGRLYNEQSSLQIQLRVKYLCYFRRIGCSEMGGTRLKAQGIDILFWTGKLIIPSGSP